MSDAATLSETLKATSTRIVLAESCTGGYAAAMLAAIPGVSKYLCGASVVYRDQTKVDWLGIDPNDIECYTSVSLPVAAQMALNVLAKTSEADFAASITGHFGPDAPPGKDGVVFIGLAWRDQGEPRLYEVVVRRLNTHTRLARRDQAANLMCSQLNDCIRTTHRQLAGDT